MMRNMSRSAWLVFVLLFAESLAIDPAMTAQTAPEKTADKAPLPFGALKWRSVGPERGGRSIAVAGSAQRPLRVPTLAPPAAASGKRPTAA